MPSYFAPRYMWVDLQFLDIPGEFVFETAIKNEYQILQTPIFIIQWVLFLFVKIKYPRTKKIHVSSYTRVIDGESLARDEA